MWAGLRLINGYSPIRAAGVGPAWTFYTHGEIDLGMAEYLLDFQAGPNELLALLGVDGIMVDRASSLVPKPAAEWQLVHEEADGRVYHRVGGPLGRVRSVQLPNEKSAIATVRLLSDARQKVVAEINVPAGGAPATISFLAPVLRRLPGEVRGQKIPVESYRGLAPMIRLPAGTHGRLTMVYRPWWLVAGGALAALSLLVILLSSLAALRAEPQ